MVVLPLLAKLQDPNTDWTVLTENPWALGKVPDKRAIQPLYVSNFYASQPYWDLAKIRNSTLPPTSHDEEFAKKNPISYIRHFLRPAISLDTSLGHTVPIIEGVVDTNPQVGEMIAVLLSAGRLRSGSQ